MQIFQTSLLMTTAGFLYCDMLFIEAPSESSALIFSTYDDLYSTRQTNSPFPARGF